MWSAWVGWSIDLHWEPLSACLSAFQMHPRHSDQSAMLHLSCFNKPWARGNTNTCTLVRERVGVSDWETEWGRVEAGEVEGQILFWTEKLAREILRRERQKADGIVGVTGCQRHQVFHNCAWLSAVSPFVAITGFTFTAGDYREKEDMHDEIIRLKKVNELQKECCVFILFMVGRVREVLWLLCSWLCRMGSWGLEFPPI